MRIRVYPYKQGSRSAASLAAALGGRVLRLEGSRFRARANDVIINWGASRPTRECTFNGGGTGEASDKLAAFAVMDAAGVRVPRFWRTADEIPTEDVRWPVVCRTVLNGHSGRGIVMAASRDQLVPAPLYVEYVPKQDEYRVHVVRGEVIAVQRKARRLEVEEPNWQIRNHANGFNFVREGVNPPEDVLTQSIMAIAALGLDFGAVDVVFNTRRNSAYVLEVNCAPGLEGQTVGDYANAFRRLLT